MPSLETDVAEIRDLMRRWHAINGGLHPCVPSDMRVEADLMDPFRVDPEDEWQPWRLIDSTYRESDLEQLEGRLPAPLPPYFRAFVLACHTMSMDFGEYHLPESWSNRSLDQNFFALSDSTFWESGYLLIGSARGCGDPLLLDFQDGTDDGDYAVVIFNHDVVRHTMFGDRQLLEPYRTLLATSFRDFFGMLLNCDERIFPAPLSAEETRRDRAWDEVARLLREKGLPSYYRPSEVTESDPWAIAEFLRNR